MATSFNYVDHLNVVDYCLPSFYLVRDAYQLQSKKVLDIAAGPGMYLNHFGPGSCGLEVSAKNRAKIEERGFRAFPYDLNRFPYNFPEQNFDVLFASHVIEHLESPSLFLKELSRLCPDHGRVIIGYPLHGSLLRLVDPYFSEEEMHHLYALPLTQLKVLMKAAGLEIERIFYDIPLAGRSRLFQRIQRAVQPLPYWMVAWWGNAVYVAAKPIREKATP